MNSQLNVRTGRRIAFVCSAILCCSLPGFTQQVRYNFMPGTNFSQFHTYKWAEVPGGHPDQILDAEIKQDVQNTLAQKGFAEATTGNPDMYVVYQIAIDQERQWNAWGTGFRGFGGGMGQATSSTISNGTLVVDFYQASNKQQIWQGTAAKTLDPSGNQQKNMKDLQKAINKLLKNFPPPAK